MHARLVTMASRGGGEGLRAPHPRRPHPLRTMLHARDKMIALSPFPRTSHGRMRTDVTTRHPSLRHPSRAPGGDPADTVVDYYPGDKAGDRQAGGRCWLAGWGGAGLGDPSPHRGLLESRIIPAHGVSLRTGHAQ